MPETDVLSIALEDYKGKRATMSIHIVSGSYTDAELDAFLQNNIMEHLNNISGCKVLACSVTKSLAIPVNALAVATAGVDLERGVNMGFDVDGSDYRHTIRIPGLIDGAGNGDYLAVGDLLAFDVLGAALGAPLIGTNPVVPCSRDGLDLIEVIYPSDITFHKSK